MSGKSEGPFAVQADVARGLAKRLGHSLPLGVESLKRVCTWSGLEHRRQKPIAHGRRRPMAKAPPLIPLAARISPRGSRGDGLHTV